MNAVLAKPIHAIWFIRARTVDLRQSFVAALFADLPSWLRDHPSLPGLIKKIAATHKRPHPFKSAFSDCEPCQSLARASPASRTSILRNAIALVTRSGKSSRSVALPACMSMPSGSQPVQRQSAASASSSLVA